MKSELAKARNEWLNSDIGRTCANPKSLFRSQITPAKEYLKNRLETAFIAGWTSHAKSSLSKP